MSYLSGTTYHTQQGRHQLLAVLVDLLCQLRGQASTIEICSLDLTTEVAGGLPRLFEAGSALTLCCAEIV